MINPYMFEILRAAVLKEASDIHYKVHKEPMFRLNGRLVKSGIKAKEFEESKAALYSMMRAHEIELLEKKHEVDFSFVLTDLARFRVNAYQEKDEGLSAAIRLIPLTAPSLELLNLPEAVEKLADARQGLMLITGPTGSGKSTTLAALVDKINTTKDSHVITIEDPLEFVHDSKVSIITQREVGTHVESFILGLRAAMRQDPDVILIGEMRDAESMMEAMRAASTGHLVISTLHTNDAVQTINRVVQAFPPHEQEGIRRQLANVIQGAVAQRLIPHSCGIGRVLAMDILVRTATVRDYIDRGKLAEIYQLIQEGAIDGMQSMNQSLMYLFRRGDITREAALEYSDTPKDLEQMMSGVMKGGSGTVY